MLECDNIVSHKDFKILSKGGNQRDIETKESLLVNMLKPKLNTNIASKQLIGKSTVLYSWHNR